MTHHKDDKILDPITGDRVDPHGHLNQEMDGNPYNLKTDFADIAEARGDEADENNLNNDDQQPEVEGMSPVDEE